MAYQMECYLFGRTTKVKDPDWAAVKRALETLWDYRYEKPCDDYGFIILSAEPAVKGCMYVQVAQDYGAAVQSLEARFQKLRNFRHYHIDTTMPQTLSAFETFMSGKKVDVKGWADWTKEMR